MIAHVVLLSPRSDLTPEQEERLIAGVERAAREIPSIQAVRVGRRIRHGQTYEEHMAADFGFCVIFEFEDLAGLQAYLQHPAHQDLGARFYDSMAAALAYDYEMGDAGRAREWLRH
jgi:Stress responsive A/B Barrel Domain